MITRDNVAKKLIGWFLLIVMLIMSYQCFCLGAFFGGLLATFGSYMLYLVFEHRIEIFDKPLEERRPPTKEELEYIKEHILSTTSTLIDDNEEKK